VACWSMCEIDHLGALATTILDTASPWAAPPSSAVLGDGRRWPSSRNCDRG
jgi:hypothetical protein